jgi:TP901 family phage tail tape measure protein
MSTTTTSWILKLVDRISAPLKAIQSTGGAVAMTVERINSRISILDKRSDTLTRTLKGMGLAVGAFALLSAGSVQFEEGMARANTMAEVGSGQLEIYKRQIQDIATVVPVAKKQLSEGLYNTISAGVPQNNWITFLRDSAKASVAGNAELGIVVDATSSTIKAYADEWENAGAVQDRFQKTVKLGQIPSLQALATALPRVTAVGAKLKVSQEELLSVFATASGVMGAPAEVATQFNAVLSALLKPGAEATKMATQLGIAFDANSIGKAGGLQNYIEELMPKIQAFSDKTGTTQEQIIGNLFGSQEAIKLVIGLGGSLSESFAENTVKIGQSTGAVQKGFEIMAATTTSQLTMMGSSFGNVMDGIVGTFGPFLVMLFKGTSYILNLVVGFMRANPTLSKFVILGGGATFMVVGLTTAITLVSVRLNLMHLKLLRAALSSNVFTSGMARATLSILGFIKAGASQLTLLAGQAAGYLLSGAYLIGSFVAGLVSATAAQLGLNVAMSANPIGLIVIGIAAAIGVIILMIKYWDEIKNTIASFASWMVKNNPFNILVNLINNVFPGFRQKIEALKTWVKSLLMGVWDSIKKVWQGIKEFFGFGDEETSVQIEVTKKTTGNISPLETPAGAVDLSGTTKTPTGSETPLVSGSGNGGAKILTMNLDIVNNFNLQPGNWKNQVDQLADDIVGKINDRLRDGAISLG